nr:hypothetical protein [uncultured Pseudomonas sp.]
MHLGTQPLPCQLVIVRQDAEGPPRHRVRYRSLKAFGSLDNAVSQTDGAELTLFVWRVLRTSRSTLSARPVR